MELIKVVNVKEVEGRTVLVERDARGIAGKLYGIDIPVYPFTVASFADDVEELKAKNDGVLDSEYLLDIADEVTHTIDRTQDVFTDAVAKKFPKLTEEHKKALVDDLMGAYASGVMGSGDGVKVLSKDVLHKLCASDAFMYMYILHCVGKMKAGHNVLKALVLDNTIFATCQVLMLTQEGKLYVSDCANVESFYYGDENITDITQEVFELMQDYNVIPQDTESLRDWLNTYEGDTEKAGRVLADNLAHILFGYTENDTIRVNVVHTATERVLKKGLSLADDVLRKHALKQVQAQDFTGADF